MGAGERVWLLAAILALVIAYAKLVIYVFDVRLNVVSFLTQLFDRRALLARERAGKARAEISYPVWAAM